MHATDDPSLTPSAPPVPDADADAPRSLFQELAGGTAGPAVKVAVSLALAPLLIGAGLLVSFMLAAAGWQNAAWSPEYTVPSDEVTAVMMVAAGLAYLAAVAWIWTRNRPRHRPMWGAALLTIGIGAVTTLAGLVAEDAIQGAEEYVIGGIVCVAIAAVLLIWVQAARRCRRSVPLRDRQDGALDVRCPSCGYRMVGLHESRCPECGAAYTLDDLLARQHFITGAHRQRSGFAAQPPFPPTPPPPPPPAPRPEAGSAAAGAG